MAYVMSTDYEPIGDLGAEPCPPGTVPNPRYPASSSTPCKPARGAVAAPAVTPFVGRSDLPGRAPLTPELSPMAPPLSPEEMAARKVAPPAPPSEEPWYQKYKYYILSGAVIAAGGAVAYTMLGKKGRAVAGMADECAQGNHYWNAAKRSWVLCPGKSQTYGQRY